MSNKSVHDNEHLFQKVRDIIENARHKVYRTVNTEMLRAYWNVGRVIVEEEQKGQDRAKYGSALLEELAKRLKWNALRSELSWTHYRLLLKVEKEDARSYYLQEALSGNWSTRQLERQINSLYFDRLRISKTKKDF